MEENLKDLLKFQVNRNVINVYKDFLNIAEDLHRDGHIKNEKYQFLRKRILDKGNDCIRELEILINKFDLVSLNKDNK